MFLKTIIFAFLAVVVLADNQSIAQHGNSVKDFLQKSCKVNGNEDKMEAVENAGKNFVECLSNLFNPYVLRQEVEAAKPIGKLDEVFKKYCDKAPQLKACIHALGDGVSPCIDENLRQNMLFSRNIYDQLIDFVCYEDGNRITQFVAEGGPECYQEKSTTVRECAIKVKGATSIEAFSALSLEENCAKLEELATCFVNVLKQCSSPTPGKMVESLYTYVKNGSSCKK